MQMFEKNSAKWEKNSAYFKSGVFPAFFIRLTQTLLALELYFRKSCADNCFKNAVFYEKNLFSIIFGRFFHKLAANHFFYGRYFTELFCRIFGRLVLHSSEV
jgi:hypothetical protein